MLYFLLPFIYVIPFCGVLFANSDKEFSLSSTGKFQSGLVDIGGDQKIYIECMGEGSPTVVFVSGRSDRASGWSMANEKPPVFSEVAKFTHVCAYDRPGTVTVLEGDVILPSRSTSVSQPTTPKDAVDNLHALVKAVKIPIPFVLVGHSYAGLIVRLYASTYPEEVAGLVLIDTLTELLFDSFTPEQQEMWLRMHNIYAPELDQYTVQERVDFKPSFEQLRAAPAPREIPVSILVADTPFDIKALIDQGLIPKDTPIDFGDLIFKTHLSSQRRLAKLLHAKIMTETHAGHNIHTEQPQIVVEAIRSIVEQVRQRKEQERMEQERKGH